MELFYNQGEQLGLRGGLVESCSKQHIILCSFPREHRPTDSARPFGVRSYFCCCLVRVMPNSFTTPWIVAHQAPLSMRCPRQEYWNGLPFPSPGDLADPGIEHWVCLHWQADSLLTEPYVVGSLLHKGSREDALCNIKTYIKAHLLSIYHVPGSILNPPVLYHLRQPPYEANSTITHFTDRKTEAQRGLVNSPIDSSWWKIQPQAG